MITSLYAKKDKLRVLSQSLESKKRKGYMTALKRKLTANTGRAEGCSKRKPFLLGQSRTDCRTGLKGRWKFSRQRGRWRRHEEERGGPDEGILS